MTELKPCPFCGGSAFTAKEIYPTGEEAWHVLHWEDGNCFIANTINGDYDTEEEARTAAKHYNDNQGPVNRFNYYYAKQYD